MKAKRKRIKFLKKCLRQHEKLINTFRYRYFAMGADFEKFRTSVLFRLMDEWKKMQEEYDELMGRS